jgi:hypothetical protein
VFASTQDDRSPLHDNVTARIAIGWAPARRHMPQADNSLASPLHYLNAAAQFSDSAR